MKITAHAIDDWECVCHNRPHTDGFYPCDDKGREVEPSEVDWLTSKYVCGGCGAIIDQNTLEIVGYNMTAERIINELKGIHKLLS